MACTITGPDGHRFFFFLLWKYLEKYVYRNQRHTIYTCAILYGIATINQAPLRSGNISWPARSPDLTATEFFFCYGNTWKSMYTRINDTQYMRLRVRFYMELQPLIKRRCVLETSHGLHDHRTWRPPIFFFAMEMLGKVCIQESTTHNTWGCVCDSIWNCNH